MYLSGRDPGDTLQLTMLMCGCDQEELCAELRVEVLQCYCYGHQAEQCRCTDTASPDCSALRYNIFKDLAVAIMLGNNLFHR